MKKIFTFICLIIFAGQAFAQDKISYYAVSIPLQSLMKDKYSAYELSFTNISNNPIKADYIKCHNKINVPDISQSMKLKKGTKWAIALCPFTLGISCLGAMPEITDKQRQQALLLDEQSKYSSYLSDSLTVTKAALQPGETIRFHIMVPINEKPQINAVFQDMSNQEYFNVTEN